MSELRMWISNLNLCARHYNILNLSYRKKATFKLLSCVQYSQHVKDNHYSADSQRLADKIIYNSFTTPTHYLEVFRQRKLDHKYDRKSVGSNSPVSLRLLDDSRVSSKPIVESKQLLDDLSKYDCKPNLPYQYSIDYGVKETGVGGESERVSVRTGVSVESMLVDESIKGAKTWMNDYEKYCTTEENVPDNNDWLVNYGTADPDVPVSKIACGGCGAYLHCREPSLPGYLPSEIFLECEQRELKALLCQRCHFLKNYNTALSVHVDPDKYVQLISKIKPKALVLLLVDLTDTAGSVWPEITDILGQGRPIFLVGNKVDLLWGDRVGWLNHADKILRRCVPRNSRIVESCLISAKTGFGVEDLVSKLHGVWRGTDDVYLVGCTNVGKSTLFNALIQSDYCKTKAVDLVQRATTAPWPGTTLNLLKFPILRPSAWRLAVRNVRLNMEKSRNKAETLLKKIQKQAERKRPTTPPQLIGNISHTFKNLDADEEESPDLFSLPKRVKDSDLEEHRVSLVDSKERDFEGRWCFDTPGVLHKNQILNLLTAEELLLTIPRELIIPRTYLIYEGMSLFIACLARLDYIKGDRGVRVTVFSSNKLPITICNSEDSDQVYEGLLGSELSLVPQGSETRLKEWPGLSPSEPITLCGVDRDQSCADVTFSTTGWVSVTPERNEICKLVAWSPLKRGISVRHPSILPFAVKLRGKKIPRSPSYSRTRIFR